MAFDIVQVQKKVLVQGAAKLIESFQALSHRRLAGIGFQPGNRVTSHRIIVRPFFAGTGRDQLPVGVVLVCHHRQRFDELGIEQTIAERVADAFQVMRYGGELLV